MKKFIKYILKKILNAGEKETVADAVQRKKYSILKKFNKKKFTVKDFKESLVNMGLKKGDTVIVHSAWRSFIGFEGRPQDVIDSIKNIIGEEGNILMPAFTDNFEVFKYNDKSCAGVITEVFRNNKDVQRSLNNMFSMCAYGKKSTLYLSEHIDSNYCFDDKSPYYKATQDDAKILLLGLGKKPHKITLFHCASYALKDKLSYYKNVYSYKKNVTIYNQNNKKINKAIIDRLPNFQNDKSKFRYLFKRNMKYVKYKKINLLDIYLFESKKVYNDVYDYILKSNYKIYK